MRRMISPAASVPASVSRYLLPHELSCITVRKHPAELAGPLILVFGGLAAAGELTRRSVRLKSVWGGYLSVLLYFLQRVAAWQASSADLASSVVLAANSRSVFSRRSPMVRSVSSVTTHSMPPTRPRSSGTGLYEKVW